MVTSRLCLCCLVPTPSQALDWRCKRKRACWSGSTEVAMDWDHGWDYHLQFLGRARRAAAETDCEGVCAGNGLLSSKWDMPEAVLPSPGQSVPLWIDTTRSGNGFRALPPPWGQIPLGGRRPVSNLICSSLQGGPCGCGHNARATLLQGSCECPG